jgi:hypothetical protein
MRVLFVITLLVALVLPSGHTAASPSSGNSAEGLPTFGEAAAARQIEISKIDLPTLQIQAAQGNADAQYRLGDLYNFGDLVPQDYMKAAFLIASIARVSLRGCSCLVRIPPR